MDIAWKLDILRALQGNISDICETKNGYLFKVEWSVNEPVFSHSVFTCELINCREFILDLYGKMRIDNIEEFKKYDIEINTTEVEKDKLVINCLINHRWSKIYIETEIIKVYDELNNEISPLDFLIMRRGLCSTGIGIDFSIGNTIEDTEEENVRFDEEVYAYLLDKEQHWHRYKYGGPKKEIDLLIGLDQYGDKIFTKDEVNILIQICNGLCGKYKSDNLIDIKIRYFAENLKDMCEKALLRNRRIVAVGD